MCSGVCIHLPQSPACVFMSKAQHFVFALPLCSQGLPFKYLWASIMLDAQYLVYNIPSVNIY